MGHLTQPGARVLRDLCVRAIGEVIEERAGQLAEVIEDALAWAFRLLSSESWTVSGWLLQCSDVPGDVPWIKLSLLSPFLVDFNSTKASGGQSCGKSGRLENR